ncbi:hypothetical protein NPIL_678491 [Nephila pilipes]|uniref:Uncharacterized protein n=1 Tax=Nephila pilipes TaxID=299642 RepID=A0A8X6PQY6_NEPPI|nr:hypothetical protein NPIL_678491 [Nephila pilipes]
MDELIISPIATAFQRPASSKLHRQKSASCDPSSRDRTRVSNTYYYCASNSPWTESIICTIACNSYMDEPYIAAKKLHQRPPSSKPAGQNPQLVCDSLSRDSAIEFSNVIIM